MTDDGGCLLFLTGRTDIQFFSVFQDMTEVRPLLVLSGTFAGLYSRNKNGNNGWMFWFLINNGNIK